jgi:hypothetical protein
MPAVRIFILSHHAINIAQMPDLSTDYYSPAANSFPHVVTLDLGCTNRLSVLRGVAEDWPDDPCTYAFSYTGHSLTRVHQLVSQ